MLVQFIVVSFASGKMQNFMVLLIPPNLTPETKPFSPHTKSYETQLTLEIHEHNSAAMNTYVLLEWLCVMCIYRTDLCKKNYNVDLLLSIIFEAVHVKRNLH